MNMNFLALNDDVKFIIASHLQSDRKINKIFMNESDDNLQKILFVRSGVDTRLSWFCSYNVFVVMKFFAQIFKPFFMRYGRMVKPKVLLRKHAFARSRKRRSL